MRVPQCMSPQFTWPELCNLVMLVRLSFFARARTVKPISLGTILVTHYFRSGSTVNMCIFIFVKWSSCQNQHQGRVRLRSYPPRIFPLFSRHKYEGTTSSPLLPGSPQQYSSKTSLVSSEKVFDGWLPPSFRQVPHIQLSVPNTSNLTSVPMKRKTLANESFLIKININSSHLAFYIQEFNSV